MGRGEVRVEQELQPGHRASLREVESQSRARIGVAGHPPGAQVGVGDCRRPRSRALDAATAGRGGDPAREVQQSFDIAPHAGKDGAGQFVCRSRGKRQRPEDAGILLTGSHEGGRAQGPGCDEGAPGQGGDLHAAEDLGGGSRSRCRHDQLGHGVNAGDGELGDPEAIGCAGGDRVQLDPQSGGHTGWCRQRDHGVRLEDVARDRAGVGADPHPRGLGLDRVAARQLDREPADLLRR